MANVNAFIKQARDQGYSDDEINAVLVKNGQKPISSLRKIVESPLIPAAFGGAGLLGGAAFAVPTLGASLPIGGAVGAGAGTATQNILKDLLGYQADTPINQLEGAVNNVALGAATGEGLGMASNLMNPMKSLGQTRSTLIGGKTVPTQEFQQASLKNLESNPYYTRAPQETQQAANSQLMNFHAGFQPSETTPINDIYSGLTPFERQAKAYGGTSPISQGTELASRAIRDYVTPNIPWAAQRVNDVYGLLSKVKPAVPWIAGGAGLGGLYEIVKALRGASQ